MAKLVTFFGVARDPAHTKRAGEFVFRATDRAAYVKQLVKAGHTDLIGFEEHAPVTKEQAIEILLAHPDFQDKEVQAALLPANRVAGPKAAKAPKAPKVAKVKVQKAVVGKLADKQKITGLTVEEIEDIKAKNLALLKKVGKKYLKGQVAEGREGGFSPEQEEEARQYVAEVTADLDSFKAPESLTMDQVKSLI